MQKPQVKQEEMLDFFECLDYLESTGRVGIRNRLTEYFYDSYHDATAFFMEFPEPELEVPEIIFNDLKVIRETWRIKKDEVLMYVVVPPEI